MRFFLIIAMLQFNFSCRDPAVNMRSDIDVFQEINDLERQSLGLRSTGSLKPKQIRKIDRVITKLQKKLLVKKPKFMKRFERKCSKVESKLATKTTAKNFKKTLWTRIIEVCAEAGFVSNPGQSVKVWDKNLIANGGGSSREEQITVSFPNQEESFSSIQMMFELSCPNAKCDHWDRLGSVFIRNNDNKKIEISRFATPYRVGARWQIDVTNLRPLLTGSKEVGVFIDTWASPGSDVGDGWDVSLSFKFSSGDPLRRVRKIVPLLEPVFSQDYGNGSKIDMTTRGQLSQKTDAPVEVEIVNFITGHGQANTDNCAEFCSKDHKININNQIFKKNIWRTNCAKTITLGNQMGNKSSSRAGWCPGAKVESWNVQLSLNSTDTVDYVWSPEPYTNKKNGGYDGGSHTPPRYYVSSYLIEYE